MEIYLGIDIGSVTVKVAAVDRAGQVCFVQTARSLGRPAAALKKLLGRCDRALKGAPVLGAAVTGSGRALVPELPGVSRRSEIVAHARAAQELAPQARTVIEIGGQDSKLILVYPAGDPDEVRVRDYAFNDLCAAGTGAFLDQQAARLGISVQTLARRAARADRPAAVAGRCAVFAKSDMIHLQQKGVPQARILSGLCFALARNYSATLMRAKPAEPPVVFLGGVARNEGVIRAFAELLGLGPGDVIQVEDPTATGALGAALLARSGGGASLRPGGLRLGELVPDPDASLVQEGEWARLALRKTPVLVPSPPASARRGGARGGAEVFLGVDVGSVSTGLALATDRGKLVASAYLPTRGRPVEALAGGLARLREEVGDRVRVVHAAATGSGRQLAAAVIGADLVKDEITAQAAAALCCDPRADTVIEIGGQDAKLILLEQGRVRDFALNRVCAAGTGSFLEEQAARLDVDVEQEFARLAGQSRAPALLGNRCTVFMDADLIHHQQRGRDRNDLLAGLAYAVVENYLDKVAQGRALGRRILFLGGVAANPAVVAAFENLLGKRVEVPPEHRVSGALGAALLAQEAYWAGAERTTAFRGFDLDQRQIRTRTFECQGCENLCEISRVSVVRGDGQAGRPSYFGGACERYERGAKGPLPGAPVFEAREQLVLGDLQTAEPGKVPAGAVGLPRALQGYDLAIFWAAMLGELGVPAVISHRSSKGLFHRGLSSVTAEACFPIKLLFGHVRDLCDSGVERILLPNLLELPSAQVRSGRAAPEPVRVDREFPCLYTQAGPDLIGSAHDLAGGRLIAPRLALDPRSPEWHSGLTELAEALGLPRRRVVAAAREALEQYRAYRRDLTAVGAAALENAGDRPVVVLLGRPYNLGDELLNLAVARKLTRLGALVLPMDALALDEERLGPAWDGLFWRAGRDLIRALQVLHRNPSFLPVMVTSFGCGPDAFLQKYAEAELSGRPSLILEFDEHTADAGLMTRLEAFLESAAGQTRHRGAPVHRPRTFADKQPAGRTIFVPDVGPPMRAYVAGFRAAGLESELLPESNLDSLKQGLVHSSGRECNPYSFLLGDLLKLCQRPGLDPTRAAFFTPGSDGPCLLSQYIPGMELVLQAQGLGDLLLFNPNLAEFLEHLGLPATIRFWENLVAFDLLNQVLARRRVAENFPGAADLAFEEGLDLLEQSMQGDDLAGALAGAVEGLRDATRNSVPERPVVGLVGDVFTRAVPAANNELVRKLEDRGCLVLTPPTLLDIGWYVVEENVWLARLQGRRAAALVARAKGALQTALGARLERELRGLLSIPREPGFSQVQRLLGSYLCFRMDTPLSLNVAKALHFLEQGCDAVVNAVCHGCMVGVVSDAVFRRIERDVGETPIVTLTFDGLQETNTETRLDALVEVARSRARKRLAVRGAG